MADADGTKIVISGVKYGLDDSVGRASLGDLYTLKVKLGVSVKTITKTFARFGELAENDDFSPLDMLDDAEIIRNLQGIVFLARRKAGENISVDDAGMVSFMDIEFELEDDEEEAVAEEAPKAQTDSAPVVARAARSKTTQA